MTAVLFMNTALLLRVDEIAQYAVPTLQLAKDISPVLGGVFSVVLLCGIFSTAAPMMWTVCSKLAPVGTKKSILVRPYLQLWVRAAALWHSGGHYLPIYGISGNFAAGVSGGSMYSKLHEKRENRN